MSLDLRRLAGTAALAVAASALTLPFAAPVHATPPLERVWTLLDNDGDLTHGLYYSEGAGGTQVKVEESPLADVYSVSASSDGSRVIYVRDTYVPAIDDVKQEVVVRDMSTRAVRVLESVLASTSVYPDVPRLSPDGTKAVWESHNDTTSVFSVHKALVGSGSATTLTTGYTPYAFLGNDTVLIQTPDGVTYTQPFAGGSLTAATGIPNEAIHLTVSPDGTHVAWALMTNATAPYAATMQVAPLTFTNGVASVGTAATLDGSLLNQQPAFSRNGATVFWIKTSGASGAAGDVWSASADGVTTAPAAVATTTQDEQDVAVTELPSADTAPPAAAGAAVPFVLNGTAATIKWTLPTDTDLSGVIVTRKLGSTVQKNAWVPAPGRSYADAGLVLGSTYTYTIRTVDRSGNADPGVSRNLTALKAAPTSADPTSLTSAKAAFPVTFGPVNARFTVDYLPTGTSTWKRWVTSATGRIRTFGAGATTGVLATTSIPGTNYVFRVQARDAYGNATAFVSSARAVVPYDQGKATLYGGSTIASSSAYLGSYRKLWTTSSYARVTLVGNRLQVVGQKCPSCGKFSIYAGSTLLATVDTYASTTKVRQVLFAKTYTSIATRTFTIRPKATSGRPNVILDGWAARR